MVRQVIMLLRQRRWQDALIRLGLICAASWRTSGIGCTLIGLGIYRYLHDGSDPTYLVTTGFGLIFAKDATVVGGKVKYPIEDERGIVHLRDPDNGSPFK